MKNVDLGVPSNTQSRGIPLANKYLQDGSVPIFWGDNQKIAEDTLEYDRPSGMVDNSTLVIPKVVRFIYTFDALDNIDSKFGNARMDDEPPPILWTYRSIIQWGTILTLKAEFRDPAGNPAFPYDIVSPYYDATQVFGNLGAGVMWNDVEAAHTFFANIHINGLGYDVATGASLPVRIQVRNSMGTGEIYYEGPVLSCPFFELRVYRGITWLRKRTDTGLEVFVGVFENINPPGTSGTGPPRCTFTDVNGVIKTEHPLADYLAILGDYGPCVGDTPP